MKKSKGDRIFNTVNVIFMVLISLAFIVPIVFVFTTSIMTEKEFLMRGYSLSVKDPTFEAYRQVLNPRFGLVGAFKDTVIITVMGTLCNLLATAAFGYALAKKDLPGRNFFTGFVYVTMVIGGGMIPTYFVVKNTGLFNTYWAFIIPALISPWNMFILRNFFMAIPDSLEEAALMDGANEVNILFRIILPLSKPALATIGLFHAVAHWNNWFTCVIYVPKGNIKTVQYVLQQVLNATFLLSDREMTMQEELSVPVESLKMAALVVATVPIMCVYPFLQKYFAKGVMIGSVKG